MIEWALIGVISVLALLCISAFWTSDIRKSDRKR